MQNIIAKNIEYLKPRIVFMGTSSFSSRILAALLENNYQVISVYTQKDKKVGRKQILEKSAVKILAEKNNLSIYEPAKFTNEVIAELRVQNPDIIIVASYGKILPKDVLDLPTYGPVNIHTSLLPKYRGPSPIQNAILNGENKTGVTLMFMDEGIDTGAIIDTADYAISPDATIDKVSADLADISINLLLKNLPLIVEKKHKTIPQDDTQATFCKLIKRTDGQINWNKTALEIYNQYRAFYNWPGVYTFWEQNNISKRIKLHKIRPMDNQLITQDNLQAGEIFKFDEHIGIATTAGCIVVEELQIEGKPPVNSKSFINGYPKFIGSVLK